MAMLVMTIFSGYCHHEITISTEWYHVRTHVITMRFLTYSLVLLSIKPATGRASLKGLRPAAGLQCGKKSAGRNLEIPALANRNINSPNPVFFCFFLTLRAIPGD